MKALLREHGPFALGLLPLLLILSVIFTDRLGPDPADQLMHMTGEWSARLLILTLLMSPLRHWTGIAGWIRARRTLGLFTFFYACLHLLVYLQLILGWSAARVTEELLERPYITAGFLAWLVMLPMAVTSTRGWQRRLGRRWRTLHAGIYGVALAVGLHILWQARSDIGEALVYAGVFALLLGWRVSRRFSPRSGLS